MYEQGEARNYTSRPALLRRTLGRSSEERNALKNMGRIGIHQRIHHLQDASSPERLSNNVVNLVNNGTLTSDYKEDMGVRGVVRGMVTVLTSRTEIQELHHAEENEH